MNQIHNCPISSKMNVVVPVYRKKRKKKHKQGQRKAWCIPSPKIWPGDLDLWPWKSIGFQIILRTKSVPSLVKIHWRMLILECSQGCYWKTDGSITISLRNFVGEGIKITSSSSNNSNIIQRLKPSSCPGL
jgi:hypothetical protein